MFVMKGRFLAEMLNTHNKVVRCNNSSNSRGQAQAKSSKESHFISQPAKQGKKVSLANVAKKKSNKKRRDAKQKTSKP